MKINLLIFIILLFVNTNGYSQERDFRELEYQVISDFILSEYEIFRPNLLDVNNNGDVVFFDFASFKIVVKNILGEEFQFLGDGRGRGPREFEMVFDLRVLDNGEIYLVDTDKRKIIKWNTNGNYIKEMESGGKNVNPARFAPCENTENIYILSSQYSRRGIMHLVDAGGKLELSFEKKDFERSLPFYTDGELDCDNEGNLYYATRYENSIKKFNQKGKVVFEIPVVDFLENEKIVERDGNFFDLVNGVRRSSGDVIYKDGKIFVAFSGNKDELLRIVDVYSAHDGTYEFSYKLPFTFQEITMNNDYIIILREDDEREMHLTTLKY